MKTQNIFFGNILYAVLLSFIFQGCTKDKCIESYTYIAKVPVYLSYQELRTAVNSTTPKPLEQPGKIYFKDNYIYINEIKKGIHVIDNTNPASPQNIAFINIPGNVDIAISQNTLYADSYIDLVAIDITDPKNVTVSKRITSVFPYEREYYYSKIDITKGVIIDWKDEEVTEQYECSEVVMYDNAMVKTTAVGAGGASQTGISGSMARFTIVNNYLYAIDNSIMHLFDISSVSTPQSFLNINVGWNIETIFPYNNKLFIGSQTGMYIYDNTNPSNPVKMSIYNHARQCDPVVVKDNYAYVTLRAGNACGGSENLLEVVNISNPYSPTLLKSYQMVNPYGLSINNNTLFLCDGTDGLKIYNISDPTAIDQHLLYRFQGYNTYDVIAPKDYVIMVIGPDGLYQYSYNESYQLSLLSKIPVQKKK